MLCGISNNTSKEYTTSGITELLDSLLKDNNTPKRKTFLIRFYNLSYDGNFILSDPNLKIL